MSYTVSASRKTGLTLNETNRVESILQNVSIAIRTWLGDIPLHRDRGMANKFLDRPMNVAAPAMIVEIRETIQREEPRAELLSVKFEPDPTGILIPTVEVEIIDE